MCIRTRVYVYTYTSICAYSYNPLLELHPLGVVEDVAGVWGLQHRKGALGCMTKANHFYTNHGHRKTATTATTVVGCNRTNRHEHCFLPPKELCMDPIKMVHKTS